MTDNLERNNESEHKLFTKLFGEITIQEPKGWNNDTRSYVRDKKSRGILSKTTIDLEFYGDASEWINTLFRAFGISEKVLLSKFEKSKTLISEDWNLRYVQEIDMGSFEMDSKTGKVTVKATEGGLYGDIKNRQTNKYNLIDTTAADGQDIGVLKTYPFQPQTRSIFLDSLLEDSQNGYRINSRRFISEASETHRTIPLLEVYNSDSQNVQTAFNTSESYNPLIPHAQEDNVGDIQSVGDQFYWRSDIDRNIRVKLELEFKVERVHSIRADNEEMSVELRKSELILVDDTDELIEKETLLDIQNHQNKIGITQNVSFDRTIFLKKNESLSFVFRTRANLGDGISQGKMDTYLTVIKSKLVIQDITDYPDTVSRCMKPKDLFERLIAKITGKRGLFKSSIFDEGGEYENFVIDNGFWARGFPDLISEADGEDREIQFNTSFKHAFESFNYLEPLTWFIEIDGKQEVVRIEKATYTMKNFIGVRLPAVDKIKHKASKPDFFSKIIIGHNKNLEYEEINGLDEPNGRSEFGTHISEDGNEYIIETEYRFDSVGYELIRRLQYLTNPKKDTPRDSHIWIHDTKFISGVFTHNLWTDYFDSAPTGIFSPINAWNLRLSPMNRLFYGHGYSVNRGLYHFPNKFIRFASSNSNQNLKTTFNGVTLHEKGKIKISDLEKARIEPMTSDLTFKMTQSIEDQILGTTNVDGEEVPNYFGLFEYIEKGATQYGRIVKLQTDEESKLTVQNARL